MAKFSAEQPGGARTGSIDLTACLLVVAALAGPILVLPLGWVQVSDLVSQTARTVATVAIGAAVSWALTRHRSPLAQSRARVLVGVVACVLSAFGVGHAAWDASQSARRQNEQFDQDALQRLRSLTERLNEFHFGALLTPPIAGTPVGLRNLRSLLVKYQGLLAEREALLNRDAQEPRATTGGARHEELHELYRALGRDQWALAARVSSVLDWYERHMSDIDAAAGLGRIRDPRLEGELTQLLAAVRAAERDVRARWERLAQRGRP